MSAPAYVPSVFVGLLRGHRRTAGLTQEELAERAGLSVRAVSDMERGRTRRPYPRSLRLLADALELAGAAREEFFTAGGGISSGSESEPVPPSTGHPDRIVPRQLPLGVCRFAGRARELAALDQLVAQNGEAEQG